MANPVLNSPKYGDLQSRDAMKLPEQFISQYNTFVKAVNKTTSQQKIFSPDGLQCIIIGVQPNGTFGLRLYSVAGDQYTLILAII